MGESLRRRARASNHRTPENRSKKIQVVGDRKLFRVLAKHRFPRKTAEQISALTGSAPSTVYEWMRGRTEPPFSVYIALLQG